MKAAADLPLFAQQADAVPMVRRRGDHATSHEAADRLAGRLSELHRLTLAAFSAAGPRGLTDRELEDLPQFAKFGPSTLRKRRSELYRAGRLVTVPGTDQKPLVRDGLTVWVLP